VKAVELTGKNVYTKSLRVDIGRSPKGISLYPNPVRGSEITIGFSALKGQYSLNVLNTAGQVVYRQQLNHAGGTVAQSVALPASLKAGVYNVLISGDNFKETKMFVIQ
jgi:Secretion system C-terminal sorting domain